MDLIIRVEIMGKGASRKVHGRKGLILLTISKMSGRIIPLILAFLLILTACAGLRDKKSASEYFEEGVSLVQKGKYDEAIKKYKKGLRRESRSAVGYNYLGMAYGYKYEQLRSLDWKEKEIEAFKKAIELDPNFFRPYFNLGITYYNMGKTKEAAKFFKKCLELYPEHPNRELIEKMIQAGEGEGR
jgi:tetratricopeptide (TPR) repeat protein